METKVQGKTAAEWRAMAGEAVRAEAESFERSDTDGFLSQWGHGIMRQVYRLNAEIAEAGGVWEFDAYERIATGEIAPHRVITTQYGQRVMVLDAEGRATGEFLPYAAKRDATYEKKGFRRVLVTKAAHAKTWAPAGGGYTSVQAIVVADDGQS